MRQSPQLPLVDRADRVSTVEDDNLRQEQEASRSRKILWSVLKVALSVGLIALLLRNAPLGEILFAVFNVDLWLLCLAVLLMLVVNAVFALKWCWLLRAQGIDYPYSQALGTYYIGLFLGNFLPSGFGGDVVRAFRVARWGKKTVEAAVAVGFDRFHSFWALLFLAAPAYILVGSSLGLPSELGLAIGAGVLASAGFALMTLHPRSLELVQRLIRSTPRPLQGPISSLVVGLTKLSQRLSSVAIATILAVVAQALGYYVQYLLFTSMHVSVSPLTIVVVVTSATIATIVPLSVNGIGVREGVYVLFLGVIGIPASVAMSISLLGLAVLTISSLIGGILLLVEGRHFEKKKSEGRN